jgi:signal transduction histidine kinase
MAVEQRRTKRPFTRRKQLEQDLEHVTQEMYRRNLELAQTNHTLSLLRTIDTLVLESHESLETLGSQLTQAIIKDSNYSFVALAGKLPHRPQLQLFGYAVANAPQQPNPELMGTVRVPTTFPWFKTEEKARMVQLTRMPDRKLARFMGMESKQITSLRELLPLHSVYVVKLMARGRLVGILAIGFNTPTQHLLKTDAELLDRLSEAVGVALDNRLLFEENQLVLRQLEKSNQKLRELDEAKDDFISMASHQLRTPLTSVKGYMSMVLEGDAGKVSKTQQKLLEQAFTSSQRMVYLIADLLNVSRLKTGKFVIEPTPTNLAEVVEGEINQLKETAKGRNLTLIYKKPTTFPTVQLDETKVRQVIMNFVDNAIYYTPSGGHITAAVKNTPETIEFTVTDDGMGVPKEEQHHLFNKFYRAGNAKKARPDGTGLGLFMAKKVIVAQGGALIFKSQEGKGSTFGFSFAKAHLKRLKPVTTAVGDKSNSSKLLS